MDQRIFHNLMESFFEIGDKVELTTLGTQEKESEIFYGEIECISPCFIKVRGYEAVHHENLAKINRKIPQWEIRERFQEFFSRLLFLEDINSEEKERIFRDAMIFLKINDKEDIYGWDLVFDQTTGTTLQEMAEKFFMNEKQNGDTNLFEIVIRCMRAATDIATERWSKEIIHYKMRDLKQMYPEGVPVWVKKAVGLQGDEDDDESIIL